jgi:hypothetical protein
MGKKNSPEAKMLRRQKIQAKRQKFADPCPTPKELVAHMGFIPNIPFFKNAAVAWNEENMKIALRTKEQLIEYFEDGNCRESFGSRLGGGGMLYISFFKTGNYKFTQKHGQSVMNGEGVDERMFYMVRHLEHISRPNPSEFDHKKFKTWCPFYSQGNTVIVPVSKLKDLPDHNPTTEELIEFAKLDEAQTALTEQELDELLASANEHALREFYEFTEHGLVIDEFLTDKGETLYQPRKTLKSWSLVFCAIPFIASSTKFIVADLDRVSSEGSQNLITGHFN